MNPVLAAILDTLYLAGDHPQRTPNPHQPQEVEGGAMPDDIIAKIDEVTGCQQCGKPLGRSPSDDFCSELCQHRWAEKNAGVVALPFRVGIARHPICWQVVADEVLIFNDALREIAVGHHWDSGIGQASP